LRKFSPSTRIIGANLGVGTLYENIIRQFTDDHKELDEEIYEKCCQRCLHPNPAILSLHFDLNNIAPMKSGHHTSQISLPFQRSPARCITRS
jgi:hypothetical protein